MVSYDMNKLSSMNNSDKKRQKVAIIGSGVAGVATAGALHDYGIDFRVYDRNSRPGGLWADNYPGAKGKQCRRVHIERLW